MKKITFVLIVLSFTASMSAQKQETPKPELQKNQKEIKDDKSTENPPGFKSDGCTLFPDGNYRDCCVAHDLEYYKGGSLKQRRASDKRLYRCVKNKSGKGKTFIASMMYIGVRVGGVSFLPTPFRWGFGRNKIKKAKKKAEKEKMKAEAEKKKQTGSNE